MSACVTRSGIAPVETVLVVDDTPVVRMLYRRVLEAAGLQVIEAGSAREASDVLLTRTMSLVLLDYMMPGVDGPTFLRELRACERGGERHTPVVFLSASATKEQMDESFAAGADDYIAKPVDPRVLVARVKSTISASRERATTERSNRVASQRNRLAVELDQARQVQLRQLPDVPMRVGSWRVSGAVVPCGELGGDVFDVVRGADGSVTAFVVDVSGHGLGAALVAAGVRGILRLLLASHGLVDAATVLNDQLVESGSDHYACVAIVRLTGSELEIVNAGLPPVCILEGGQVVASVSGAGTPPGLFPGAAYTSARRTVTPSARIVVMSDGLTEPFGRADDVPAGIARLALGSGDGSSPGELAARIGGALSAQEMVDDATVVMLEGTVCGAGAPYARHAS